MTDEENAKAFVRSIDLSILISALEKIKTTADSCQEYAVAESVDDILVGLRERKRALAGIIIG